MPPRSRHYKHNPLVGRMDAGQLRKHIVDRYGIVLLYGGSGERYWRMYRLIRKLVKMTGLPEKIVTQHLKEDAAIVKTNPKHKTVTDKRASKKLKKVTGAGLARMKADHKHVVKVHKYLEKALKESTKLNIAGLTDTIERLENQVDILKDKYKAHIKTMRKRARG